MEPGIGTSFLVLVDGHGLFKELAPVILVSFRNVELLFFFLVSS